MNKVILITGASSGIGKEVGEYLSKKGHIVFGTSRYPNNQTREFEIIKMEITDSQSIDKALIQIFNKVDKIDVLINNAGFGLCGSVENTSIDEAKSQFNTNYFGAVRMINKLLPHFRTNINGLIINVSSLGGLIALPFQAHYSASKYALEGFTEALRYELLPYNINICNINPGDFNTSFSKNRRFAQKIEVTYEEKFDQLMKMYESEEQKGSNPLIIAKLIQELIHKRKFKIRYLIGKKSQTIGFFIKRIVGSNLFEKLMIVLWKAK